MKLKTLALILGVAVAPMALAACETATPYQPFDRGNATYGGFRDQKIDADRYRVTFSGNSLTSRETVETYLLYRSAELTLSSGYDWFEMVDRATNRDRTVYQDPFYGRPGYAWGYWRPSWRFHGGFGWRTWDPYWGDPFWADQYQAVDRFDAEAEIVMHHGPKPEGEARAFDAHEVTANLGPKITRPEAARH
jgi:hypothetical protein